MQRGGDGVRAALGRHCCALWRPCCGVETAFQQRSGGVGAAWERREGGIGAARERREGDVRAGCCGVGPAWEQCGVGAA